jgi:hypothetical protein
MGTSSARTLLRGLTILSFAALPLAGCGAGDDSAESVDNRDDAITTAVGVDYSWARPSPAHLRSEGYSFAARYLSYEPSKNISAGEVQALKAAGMDVVVVWENGANDALDGYQTGVKHAQAAVAQAAAAGMPAGRPIYFACDFDAQPSQQAAIDAYMDGAASVIGRGRVGAYGGYSLIKRLFDGGKITWGWQTYAWSYGQWDGRAQVRQVQNGIEGGSCDKDEATAVDFGQWGATGGGAGGGAAPGLVQIAFQANTTDLWTVGDAGNKDWKLGMMPGTSPSITALSGGGFEVAFQANTGDLWTVGDAGNTDWKLGMMKGTSPSITALPGGGFEVAFQANTTSLWTVGNAGNKDWKLGMMPGTSPSIAALASGGFEVAFQANTTDLWTVGDAGNKDWQLGMMKGTSPSLTALPGSGFEVAFQANTTSLWTVGDAGNKDWQLGMMPGTSPSITALAGGFEVAFQANTTNLWTVGSAGNKDWGLGMMTGTSPAIAPMSDGTFEVWFQANTTSLWRAGAHGTGPLNLGMIAGSSPSGT